MEPATTEAAKAESSRVRAFYELTKPGIAGYVTITAGASAFVASRGSLDLWLAINTMLGTWLATAGALALTSKSTVLVPPEAATALEPKDSEAQKAGPVGSGLGVISKEINQERLNAYAKASGDDNPLHLDAEFAAKTQFGGIIAHGMLTLAFVSEMMAAAHGRDWLESGGLRVRFKGAAYLGDRVEAWGNLAKENGASRTYSVGVRNSASGQELISGTAGLNIN